MNQTNQVSFAENTVFQKPQKLILIYNECIGCVCNSVEGHTHSYEKPKTLIQYKFPSVIQGQLEVYKVSKCERSLTRSLSPKKMPNLPVICLLD